MEGGVDIATLGLRVDARQYAETVERAIAALDRLDAAGQRVTATMSGLGRSMSSAPATPAGDAGLGALADASRDVADAERERAQATDQAAQKATEQAQADREAEEAARRLERAERAAAEAERQRIEAMERARDAMRRQEEAARAYQAQLERVRQAQRDEFREAARLYDEKYGSGTAAQRALEEFQRLQLVFREQMGVIKEDLVRGLMDPDEARRRGIEAARAYNEGLLAELDKLRMSGALDTPEGQKVFVQMLESFKTVEQGGEAARVASTHWVRLSQSVTSLAGSMLGVNRVFTQSTQILSAMAVGSAWSVGIMAGMAAIGFAWRKLTEDARENKRATEEAIERLRNLARLRGLGPAGETGADVDTAREAIERRAVEIADLERLLGAAWAAGVDETTEMYVFSMQRRLERLRQKQEEEQKLLKQAGEEVRRIIEEEGARTARAFEANLLTVMQSDFGTSAQREQVEALVGVWRGVVEALQEAPVTPENLATIAQMVQQIKAAEAALQGQSSGFDAAYAAARRQLDQLRELNAAYGRSEEAIERLKLKHREEEALAQAREQWRGRELAQMEEIIRLQYEEHRRQLDLNAARAEEERINQIRTSIEAFGADQEQQIENLRAMIRAVQEGPEALERLQIRLAGAAAAADVFRRANGELTPEIAAAAEEARRNAELIAQLTLQYQKLLDTQKEGERELERIDQELARARQSVERLFADAFFNIQRDGLEGFQAFADQLVTIMQRAAAQIAAAFAAEALNLDELIRRVRAGEQLTGRDAVFAGAALGVGIGAGSRDPGIGFLGGALSAGLIGGPAGMIVGGVAGLVSGLLTQGDRLAEAQRQYDRVLRDFVNSFIETQTELERRTQIIEGELARLVEAAAAAHGVKFRGDPANRQAAEQLAGLSGGWAKNIREFGEEWLRILDMFDRATARARELAEIEVRRLGEDLAVELARAREQDELAELMELLNRQERQRAELLERYGDILPDHILALMDLVHAEQQLALFRRQEAERLRQRERFDLDVAGIRAELSGDDIERIRLQELTAHAERLRRWDELLQKHIIGQQEFDEAMALSLALVDKNIQDAIEAQQKAEEAARRSREYDRDMLNAAIMIAEGNRQAGEAMQRRAELEMQIQQAIEAGHDEAYIAALRYKHALDELAAAQQRVEMGTRLLEDGLVRMFTAVGMAAEAADARLAASQRREIAGLRLQGATPEMIAFYEALHEQEMNWQRQQRALEEAEAAIRAGNQQLEQQTRIAQDALRVQEQTFRETKRVVEALEKSLDSMLLGDLSPLSPVEQLAEAQRQFTALLERARAGEHEAALGLPSAAQTLLQAARDVFASSPGYVDIFARTRADLTSVLAQFEGRLAVEERLLAEARAASERLSSIDDNGQQVLDALRAQFEAQNQAAYEHLKALWEQAQKAEEAVARELDVYHQQLEELRRIREILEGEEALGLGRPGPRPHTQLSGTIGMPTPVATPGMFSADVASGIQTTNTKLDGILATLQVGFGQLSQRLERVEVATQENTTELRRGLEGAKL